MIIGTHPEYPLECEAEWEQLVPLIFCRKSARVVTNPLTDVPSCCYTLLLHF